MQLLFYLLLSQFPSGSAITIRDGKLFLIGDDSNAIFILSPEYQQLDKVQILYHQERRIPKKQKPDFEGATFLTIGEATYLALLGSGSDTLRKVVQLIRYDKTGLNPTFSKTISTRDFVTRLRLAGIGEVNFEGITTLDNKIIISNRGNLKNRENHLIITDADFWNRQGDASIQFSRLVVPMLPDSVVGVSEIQYDKGLDVLLLTLSSEATSNAYDDGAIGNSYLAWIQNFSTKIQEPNLSLDKIICLSEIHPEFIKQKIEGVCLERLENNFMKIHLISDNDNGESTLFCLKISVEGIKNK